jgi:hypothetical protein
MTTQFKKYSIVKPYLYCCTELAPPEFNKNIKRINESTDSKKKDEIGRLGRLGRLALFFKGVRGLNIPRLYEYLEESSMESLVDTFLLCFHIRDCRDGKGERELGRVCFVWLFIHYPHEFMNIVSIIPEYGRWDDLLSFFPNVLNLTNIEYIRNNYSIPNINYKQLIVLQILQIKIIDLCSLKLNQDINLMNEGKDCSLIAKWMPTENNKLDREFGVYKTLAKNMHITPRQLRKKYLTPLREYIKIVEKFMCSGRWDEIDFNTVPSCAMKKLKNAFKKHEENRFNEWNIGLIKGVSDLCVLKAKQLSYSYPYEIIKEIRQKGFSDEICDAKWKVHVDEVKKLDTFSKCLCVIDTSSSMHTPDFIPFDVATSMGILISECTQGVFKNMVCTFNKVPEFIKINSGTLFEKWNQVINIPHGGCTHLILFFKKLLDLVINTNKGENKNDMPDMPDMPECIFIIQFNAASSFSLTNSQEIEIDIMYKKLGYIRPKIIFWNVNVESTDSPVLVKDNGTCLISGFSTSILKSVLNGNISFPYNIMRDVLDGTRLKKIKDIMLPLSISINKQIPTFIFSRPSSPICPSAPPPSPNIFT